MAQGHRSRDGHGGLRRTVLVLGTIALVVGALLIAMMLGALAVAAAGAPAPSPAATSTGTATDDDAEEDAAPDPAVVDRACALADARLARADAEGAHALLTAAGITDDNAEVELDADCLTTWTLAAPTAPASDAKGMPERVGSGWDAFVKTTFTPLAAAAGFVVGGWLALFVLARLLVELPRMRDLTSDRASRRRTAWLGWLLLATTPIAAVLVGANAVALGALAPLMLGGIAILAGVTVVALCAWLATVRVLRIEVTAPDADDEGKRVTSALVAARLRQLTEKSGRIDLPAGPTISGLGDALKDFSSNRGVAAVQKIVLFLIGVTPWVATAVVASGTRATVTIARNSSAGWVRAVSTTGDGWEPLAKPPAKSPVAASDFLSVVVATEVLLALAERYPDDFESGLYGATKGRSVGLQFIAIEWFATRLDTSAAETLLATALRIDPRNDLARYSLAYVQHRHATDTDELVAFGETLDRWIAGRAGSAGGAGSGAAAGAGADAGFGGAGGFGGGAGAGRMPGSAGRATSVRATNCCGR
ncbi:hypothetical protein [Microbacterium sp. Marseille-Q6648]|uniref:hypothetical protein n=1 Tax=Microbacterium sp. Marseille-Q6648 TaxID=2937991 RepID=UPI00203A7A08|nr:hypothetical protein [Microbacterium sp. Marseille-Q6648]